MKRCRLKSRGKHGTRYPKSIDRKYRVWIRTFACLVCGHTESQPAHVKPWGSSAKDRGNIVPLCHWHHVEQEGKTAAFESRYGIDLAAIAVAKQREYEAAGR